MKKGEALVEVLRVLEEKIAQLVQSKKQDRELIEHLKLEIDGLQLKNQQLSAEVDRLAQEALVVQSKGSKELDDEREFTKMAVDELIQNIDELLGKESQA